MLLSFDNVEPELDSSTFIAPTAVVVGKVVLGARSSVWFQAVLRGDNDWIRIGEGTNIQDGCILHVDFGFPLTLGNDCVIGHGAVLHGCTVGNRVLVGINATVLNKAVLPDDVVIAAGALIPEGSQLQSGYLYTGVPAKPVRPLRPDELQRVARGAESYQEKAKMYKLQLEG
jgi:carbonic anhydrase/acetyltransferase-like protein (isoleucine patch superfamily)